MLNFKSNVEFKKGLGELQACAETENFWQKLAF